MNYVKRALLSVTARKGKSLLQIIIFTVICVLVLSGITIQSAATKSSELARQKLGAEVTLQVDMEKLRAQQQSEGTRTRFQSIPISTDLANELLSYSEVKAYNYYSSTYALADNFEPIENETTEEESTTENESTQEGSGGGGRMANMNADVTIQGLAFSDSYTDFTDGISTLIQGRHITEEDLDANVTMIENSLATENNLEVGDTITIASSDETQLLDLEIVGIYETTSTNTDSGMGMDLAFMNPYNKLFVPYTVASNLKGEDYKELIDSAIYYMSDPATIDQFITKAETESSIDFETFKLDANDTLYQQMVGPIQNVASFSKNIVYLVTIAGAVILGLIVMLSIRERKYEMGVLLAIGEKRWKLIGQFLTEIIVIAILALGISAVSGNLVASKVSDQLLTQEIAETEESTQPASFGGRGFGFGRDMQTTQQVETIDELEISITPKDLGFLSGIGLLIAVLSALIPSLSVLRLQPKTILTKQD
ncbi:ABC transporter permease [Litchfieldia alkalitelluris]|uniref:ABC transporter permease n=1 Tax=Litchfieldia alkalitelluris TaxID=304268 RepID=UPI0009976FE5|nr:ABC transporter permease [Litchfieldia alkalitelluris]